MTTSHPDIAADKVSRLAVLEGSLTKKQAAFDAKLSAHFGDVAAANGQPLNDKRCGAGTMARWDKQNESLRRLDAEIQRTKNAIERERSALARVAAVTDTLPPAIAARLADGSLTQWRKHPTTFFVAGVDKARIVLLDGSKQVAHKYVSSITDAGQRRVFAQAFNALSAEMRAASPITTPSAKEAS